MDILCICTNTYRKFIGVNCVIFAGIPCKLALELTLLKMFMVYFFKLLYMLYIKYNVTTV